MVSTLDSTKRVLALFRLFTPGTAKSWPLAVVSSFFSLSSSTRPVERSVKSPNLRIRLALASELSVLVVPENCEISPMPPVA